LPPVSSDQLVVFFLERLTNAPCALFICYVLCTEGL
jgi:hypothetical protein